MAPLYDFLRVARTKFSQDEPLYKGHVTVLCKLVGTVKLEVLSCCDYCGILIQLKTIIIMVFV